MPSTYTKNLGLEKIADGEQDGTWGGSERTNQELLDQAINGIVSITLTSAGSSGSPNALAITDGVLSDGRNAHIEYLDGGDLGADAYVQLTPDDAEKLVYIKNSLSGGRKLYLFQGTYSASRDYVVNNGNTAVVGFSGTGAATSVAAAIFQNLQVDGLALLNTETIEWANVAGDDVISIEVDANDDFIYTVNSTVALQFDSSGSEWDFQANDITTSGDITGGNLSGTNTGDEVASSPTVSGVIELATQAEVDAGTDALRAVTPDTLNSWPGSTPSPLTTKGDLYGFSTVNARLPVGTNGYGLVADSGETLGVKWAAIAGDMAYGTASTTAGDVYQQSHQDLSERTSGQESIQVGEYESHYLPIGGNSVTIDINTATYVGTGAKLITGRCWVHMNGTHSGLTATSDVTGAVIIGSPPDTSGDDAMLVWEYQRTSGGTERLWVQWLNDS